METTRSSLVTQLIEGEKQSLRTLQGTLNKLRNQVEEMETKIESLGDKAMTMPEDLGDWSNASYRIQGIVSRIIQTHQLSIKVSALPPKPIPRHENDLSEAHVPAPLLAECKAKRPPKLSPQMLM